jgi:hypothetical protein
MSVDLVTPEELAKRLKLDPRTLQQWRRRNQGPPWIRVSHRVVRYPADQLEAWLASRSSLAA